MNWPGLWWVLTRGTAFAVFTTALYLAAVSAIARYQWAADLAFAVGLISEDDLGDER